MLADKWIVMAISGMAHWQILVRYGILIAPQVGDTENPFGSVKYLVLLLLTFLDQVSLGGFGRLGNSAQKTPLGLLRP
jgi:hypothetical protein